MNRRANKAEKRVAYWASELWETHFVCTSRKGKAWIKRRLARARRRAANARKDSFT